MVPLLGLSIMNQVLNIFQWNVRGLKFNRLFIDHLITKNKINIITLQETHLDEEDDICIRHFQIFRNYRDSRGGGLLIGIHQSILCQEVDLQTNLEVLAVKIILPDITFILLNCYVPTSTRAYVHELEKVLDNISGKPPYLLLGDFNSHHMLWNCEKEDTRGKDLLTLINKQELYLVNGPQATYVSDTHKTATTLDLAFAKEELYDRLSWSLIPERYCSDHFPILITSTLQAGKKHKRPYWKIKGRNWKVFEEDLELPDIDFGVPIDQYHVEFFQSIIEMAHQCFKQSSVSCDVPSQKGWWTSDCDGAVKLKNSMFRNFKNNPTTENLINY